MRSGFTLIELVVVLLVLGIATAAVVPSLALRPSDTAGEDAHVVMRLLRAARMGALDRGEAVTLDIQVSTGRYTSSLRRPDADSVIAEGTLPLAPGSQIKAHRATAAWTFGADGSVWGDTVRVGPPEAAVLVRIEPWTGTIHAGH